jgi:hypothetical protein
MTSVVYSSRFVLHIFRGFIMTYVITYAVQGLFLFAIYILYRTARGAQNTYFRILCTIAILYPLGKVIQFGLIGPGWLRWHMSDAGWVSCMAIFMAFGPLEKRGLLHERLRNGTHIVFGVAVIMELLQLSVPKASAHKDLFTAAGDWVDLAIFFVMYGVNLLLIWRMSPPMPMPAVAKKKKLGAQATLTKRMRRGKGRR